MPDFREIGSNPIFAPLQLSWTPFDGGIAVWVALAMPVLWCSRHTPCAVR